MIMELDNYLNFFNELYAFVVPEIISGFTLLFSVVTVTRMGPVR